MMRPDPAHLRRREAFIARALETALDELDAVVSRTPVKTPHGAEGLTAVALIDGGVWDLDGRTMADGFALLWEDRRDHGTATALEGVSTAWRDRMLQARATGTKIAGPDALRILRLAIYR
jgi:hypothetical protein